MDIRGGVVSVALAKRTPGSAGGLKELIAMKKVNKKKSPSCNEKGLPTKLISTGYSFMTNSKATDLKSLTIGRFGPFTGGGASDASERFFNAS